MFVSFTPINCIVLDDVFGILHVYLLRAVVHGRVGVLLALSETPLGRVPKQVLQGQWLQVQPFLLRKRAQERNEKEVNLKNNQFIQ